MLQLFLFIICSGYLIYGSEVVKTYDSDGTFSYTIPAECCGPYLSDVTIFGSGAGGFFFLCFNLYSTKKVEVDMQLQHSPNYQEEVFLCFLIYFKQNYF